MALDGFGDPVAAGKPSTVRLGARDLVDALVAAAPDIGQSKYGGAEPSECVGVRLRIRVALVHA